MPSGDFRPPSTDWQQGYDAGYREAQEDALSAHRVEPAPTLDVAARAYREAHDLLAVTHTSAQRTVVIERLNDLAKAALAARDEHLAALTRRRP